MPALDPTVAPLVEAARGGDERAWRELHGRYSAVVHAVTTHYRLQPADAADVAANTWLRAFERLDRLRDDNRFGAWLRTIAGRECLAMLRRTRSERSLDAWPAERPTDAPGPELVALGKEESRAVGVALERLPHRARWLIETMAALPDAGYAEIAERTGMPVGSIGPTRGRALRQLRTGLEHAGFSLSA